MSGMIALEGQLNGIIKEVCFNFYYLPVLFYKYLSLSVHNWMKNLNIYKLISKRIQVDSLIL